MNLASKGIISLQSFLNINEHFGFPIYTETSYQYDNTGNHIGGIRSVFHFSPFKRYSSVESSIGGEAYYSLKDKVGGGNYFINFPYLQLAWFLEQLSIQIRVLLFPVTQFLVICPQPIQQNFRHIT